MQSGLETCTPQALSRMTGYSQSGTSSKKESDPVLTAPKGRIMLGFNGSSAQADSVPFFDTTSGDFPTKVELLTIAEVAKILKVSVVKMRRLQQGLHIPFLKIGGSIRFLQSDVLSFIESCRVKSLEYK